MPDSNENSPEDDAQTQAGLSRKDEKEAGALSPELRDLAGKAVEYHESALSENTREAYQRGWKDFVSFCDTHGIETAPATERVRHGGMRSRQKKCVLFSLT